jgi:hypothetical protein
MQSQSSGKTIAIIAYKPKPGKQADLLPLTREHVPMLRAEGLATDHPVTACRAKDGTVSISRQTASVAPGSQPFAAVSAYRAGLL